MTQKYTRDEMITMLKAGECQVTFTKVNGEKRIMTCTLNEQLLAAAAFVQTEKTKPKKVNEEVLPVYDVNAKGWRSFRIDSVEDFTTAIG
jgi:hypothetical protein